MWWGAWKRTPELAAKSNTCEPLQEPKINEWKGMRIQDGWKVNHHTDEAHTAASEGMASDYIDNGQMDAPKELVTRW
jgi:hypothetical protein